MVRNWPGLNVLNVSQLDLATIKTKLTYINQIYLADSGLPHHYYESIHSSERKRGNLYVASVMISITLILIQYN